MRIIGIDPGTRVSGYGVLDFNLKGKYLPIAAGAWKLDSCVSAQNKCHLATRLGVLAVEFRKIVELYKPSHLCLELSFFADNPRTALLLGHARGVILAEAYQKDMEICELSATAVKKLIAGNGRASKINIAKMLSQALGFNIEKLPFDATDALAIAYAAALIQNSKGIYVDK